MRYNGIIAIGYIALSFILVSCSKSTVKVINDKYGFLTSTYELVETTEKKIALDDLTAPGSVYMQMISGPEGSRYLSLLNKYNNSIYIFDYNTTEFVTNISYDREGANGVLSVGGYYIKNMDSIYLYNRPMIELVLADSAGQVKNRISLKGLEENWYDYLPQYDFKTVCPIIERENMLLLTGFNPFELKASLINKFFFTTCFNTKTNEINHFHTYPVEIFGDNANWGDPAYMQVYPALMPSGEILHSFTPSHDLYISDWNSNTKRAVYGGSNVSKNISSIDWDTNSGVAPSQLLHAHYMQQDLYAAVLYDPFREVYYRYMQQGIPDATTNTHVINKNIVIIILDKNFQYLGETAIGTGEIWNWNNSFVTEEGLNIEYKDVNDLEEEYLYLKIFNIKKI